MAGSRKARLPTVAKLLGADYKTPTEAKSEEEAAGGLAALFG